MAKKEGRETKETEKGRHEEKKWKKKQCKKWEWRRFRKI